MTRKPTDPLPDHYGTDDWEDIEASPSPVSEEMAPKDVEAIRDHAARILARMRKTPYGPKRKLLAAQHVDLTNEALRAEGWNAALAAKGWQ